MRSLELHIYCAIKNSRILKNIAVEAGLFKSVAVKGLAIEYYGSTLMFIFTLWSLYPKENIPRTHWIGSWWLGPSESGYDGEQKNLTILTQFIPTVLLIIRNITCPIQNCCEELNSNLPGSSFSSHFTLTLKMF